MNDVDQPVLGLLSSMTVVYGPTKPSLRIYEYLNSSPSTSLLQMFLVRSRSRVFFGVSAYLGRTALIAVRLKAFMVALGKGWAKNYLIVGEGDRYGVLDGCVCCGEGMRGGTTRRTPKNGSWESSIRKKYNREKRKYQT